MGRFRGGTFCIDIIRVNLCFRTYNVRHFYYGRSDTVMSIFIAVIGAGIWSALVYLTLLLLGAKL